MEVSPFMQTACHPVGWNLVARLDKAPTYTSNERYSRGVQDLPRTALHAELVFSNIAQ